MTSSDGDKNCQSLMREHADYMASYDEPFVGSTAAIARALRTGADRIDDLEQQLARPSQGRSEEAVAAEALSLFLENRDKHGHSEDKAIYETLRDFADAESYESERLSPLAAPTEADEILEVADEYMERMDFAERELARIQAAFGVSTNDAVVMKAHELEDRIAPSYSVTPSEQDIHDAALAVTKVYFEIAEEALGSADEVRKRFKAKFAKGMDSLVEDLLGRTSARSTPAAHIESPEDVDARTALAVSSTAAPLADELERLGAEATDGPWAWDQRGEKVNEWGLGVAFNAQENRYVGRFTDENAIYDEYVCSHEAATCNYKDPELICALRNNLPTIIAALRSATGERQK